MSEDIRVAIMRGQTPVVQNILLQLDKMNALEAAAFQGADPHFTYRAFTTQLPTDDPQFILFRDHMIDQQVIDAVTGKPRRYLIISDAEFHMLDGHWQWVCTRMRGT